MTVLASNVGAPALEIWVKCCFRELAMPDFSAVRSLELETTFEGSHHWQLLLFVGCDDRPAE
jgi:hypothetical protein